MDAGAQWEGRTIGSALRDAGRKFDDQLFLIDKEQRLTFAQVDALADQLAAGLLSIGVRRGDHVACWLTNCPTWTILWMACCRIGACVVSINTRYKQTEVEFILRQSNAKVLVAMQRYWDIDYQAMVTSMAPQLMGAGEVETASSLPGLETVVFWGDARVPGCLSIDELLAKGADTSMVARAESEVDPNDPVVIIYTSGTTGLPKGATHGHRVLMNGANTARALHMEVGDRVLGHMPFYHVAGSVATTIPALQTGCAIVMMSQWDPATAIELIVAERVAVMGGIPTHFVDLLDVPGVESLDTSCLKSAWIGGAPVTPKVAKASLEVLQFDSLMAVWGMTETMGATTLAPFDAPIEVTCANKSKPIGDFEMKVVDPDTGEERGLGADGEIWIRGYVVMQGYYNNPEATAQAMTPDGWFKTGDLARVDEDGYFQITGRSKEMFIVGGSNAYPAEIERYLEALPMVHQAMVCGVPHERLGEVCFAFVEPAEGVECTAQGVIDACRSGIADYKVPRQVVVMDEFPRTTTNKIQRYLLQRQAADMTTVA
ncbi:MAG: AMP-binding protein [Gammaproteobacteria bacterium]|nr:AMP-binding protein [Gammaproteobacteria bacterium]